MRHDLPHCAAFAEANGGVPSGTTGEAMITDVCLVALWLFTQLLAPLFAVFGTIRLALDAT